MSNEEVWKLACEDTLKNISKVLIRITENESLPLTIRAAYKILSKDILTFPIESFPECLKRESNE